MNGLVTKSGTRSSRAKFSKTSQEELPATSPSKGRSRRSGERSVQTRNRARTTTPVRSRESQIDTTSEISPRAKRARLGSTKLGTEKEGAERVTKDDGAEQAIKDDGAKQAIKGNGAEQTAKENGTQQTTKDKESERPLRLRRNNIARKSNPDGTSSHPHRSQKRQIDAESDRPQSGPSPAKRTRLTRANLRLWNKMTESPDTMGMPDEGKPAEAQRSLSKRASGFEAKARKDGILDRASSKPPISLDELRAMADRDRETASPSESVYNGYVRAVEFADNEHTMIHETMKLLAVYQDGYRTTLSHAFTALPKDAGFNNGLSAPHPDMIQGPGVRSFEPFPVEDELGGAAVLIKDVPNSITLPHLAGEWKRPGKDMMQARTQSSYDGAALVHGRNRALTYLGKPDPAGHAAVITFTTDGTNINFFAHYAAPSESERKTEYHQYPITSTNMTNSYEEFKNARKQLRNVQDYAREQSYALRDQLKDYWKTKTTPHPANSQGRRR